MTAGQPKLRVVLVENEALLRLAAEEMLLELGHEIVGWANRARIAIAETERTRPDLVLMDIQLDGPRDGVEAAHEIRNKFGIASLFMTGSTDTNTYQRALRTQPLGYLHKPFLLPELRSALAPLAHTPAASRPVSPMMTVQFVSFDMARKKPSDSSD
jgi:DNA-binding NarL/FixJ family response regulator